MSDNQLMIPKSITDAITNIFVPENISDDSEMELKIIFGLEELSVRDFSNYLAILDRFYSRLYPDGAYAYGRRDWEQLKICEVRQGSIEVIIQETIDKYHYLPMVYLLLRYLPSAFKDFTEGIKNLTDSYKTMYEVSILKTIKSERMELKKSINDDEDLASLNSKSKNQLLELLIEIYSKEGKKLPRAKKTARKNVKSVELRVKKKKTK